ncbi:2-isopropylmalate synthase [Noviherbaspirillum denitrificans]|uniref:2-isopropylmalate synthase n=1 Tax=Noviherbaspirillum denitrificans TaxID=1968433 RepID=A0A254TB14_9BURK|nr:2-isopropylmalate synthase [Noviherbaspirillum denitrificans]OWW19745.1 2-isopropylmalate synthase [Noviherbaspirillum denitrificans]
MVLQNPAAKYRPFPPVQLTSRSWPDQVISKPPVWLSTDLRDGNQSLIEPLSPESKLRFFDMLVGIGLKEIEVAFPSASQTDFDFVRKLIEEDRIPDDVTIGVLTQSREDLIRRTIESVRGAKRAIIHLYNAVSPAFRRIVFGMSREEVREIAVSGTRLIKELTKQYPETEWVFQYSPETFSMTELDFAKVMCDAVSAMWQPTPQRKMIINLPSTVECATPNVYADQIEWMHRKLSRRDSIILSVHPHNDRGTAVASAELALMAGADRVEGCLFGNGERTGNVDLVTLAMNLYTQGVHPGLDFSDIDAVRKCVEECNQIPVHPRHPYAGDLVYTAFSGSHQDAIKKGFAQQRPDTIWEVPYLPIDPADVGRNYDAVIRVNSQSGKGGMAYLLENAYGLKLPRRLQIEFSRAVQQATDGTGKEVSAEDIYSLFRHEYLEADTPYTYRSHRMSEDDAAGVTKVEADLHRGGAAWHVGASGNGPIDAFARALGIDVVIMDYQEHALGSGAGARAACYVELRVNNGPSLFGVGIHENIVTASFVAVLRAINRHNAQQDGLEGTAMKAA